MRFCGLTPDYLPYRAFFCLSAAGRLRSLHNRALRSAAPLAAAKNVTLNQMAFAPPGTNSGARRPHLQPRLTPGISSASDELAQQQKTECWPQWPYNQLVLLGLGRTALSLQDWQAAEAAFGKLADTAFPPVPALKNLALTLDAQGRTAWRMEVAGRAVRSCGSFIVQD